MVGGRGGPDPHHPASPRLVAKNMLYVEKQPDRTLWHTLIETDEGLLIGHWGEMCVCGRGGGALVMPMGRVSIAKLTTHTLLEALTTFTRH